MGLWEQLDEKLAGHAQRVQGPDPAAGMDFFPLKTILNGTFIGCKLESRIICSIISNMCQKYSCFRINKVALGRTNEKPFFNDKNFYVNLKNPNLRLLSMFSPW